MEAYTVSIDRKEHMMTENKNQDEQAGWFNNNGLFDIVEPFITEVEQEHEYSFSGLDGGAAVHLLSLLPEWYSGDESCELNVRTALEAASLCPEIKFDGYVKLAPRGDEGLVVSTIAIPETALELVTTGATLKKWHWEMFRTRLGLPETLRYPTRTFKLSDKRPTYWIAKWNVYISWFDFD